MNYTLTYLLDRIDQKKEEQGLNKKQKLILPKPVVNREGRKSVLSNYNEICKTLNRTTAEVKEYICEELSTVGTILGENELSIKGNFRDKNLKKVLGKYVMSYVLCKQCGSMKTSIIKQNRIKFIKCSTCHSMLAIN
jgi:translation initiation factor 2 subunit 2